MKKLGFIGVGNMGEAVLKGVISSQKVARENILVRNSSDNSTKKVAERNGVQAANSSKDLAKECDVVFLGVKPYLVASVLEEIKVELEGKIVISMAAAVEIKNIESIVPRAKVVRIMPNTPVEVGAGVVGVSVGHNIESTEVAYVLSLFSSLGLSEVIAEKDMAGLTALSGSGPAYGYLFIEALADGAVLNGLHRETAYRLAAHTVIGAAKMVLETGEHPGKLKDNVCSPSGSTIEAIRILEEKNFRSAVIESEKACFEKLKEM